MRQTSMPLPLALSQYDKTQPPAKLVVVMMRAYHHAVLGVYAKRYSNMARAQQLQLYC